MTEPMSLGEAGADRIARRIAAALEARGIPPVEGGPIEDRPVNEPGDPEFHRQRRAEWALKRWEAATPYRYQQAVSSHPGVREWTHRVATEPRSAGFLLLNGPFGTGKTHEAYGALRLIANSGPERYEFIAITAPDMYALLRPGGSERGTEYEVKRLKKIPLLLIDDLGTEKITEFTEEATYRLLNERYNESLPTLITSNLEADSRDEKGVRQGPDLTTTLGTRITDRLRQMTTVIGMEGPSRRGAA